MSADSPAGSAPFERNLEGEATAPTLKLVVAARESGSVLILIGVGAHAFDSGDQLLALLEVAVQHGDEVSVADSGANAFGLELAFFVQRVDGLELGRAAASAASAIGVELAVSAAAPASAAESAAPAFKLARVELAVATLELAGIEFAVAALVIRILRLLRKQILGRTE